MFSISDRFTADVQKTKKGLSANLIFDCGTIPKKLMEQKKRKKSGKNGKGEPKSFDKHFSIIFSCYNQSLFSGRETGH